MSLQDDLIAEVRSSFDANWDRQTTSGVPDPKDILLNSNHAKQLEEAVVLYADIDGSTSMVDDRPWWFAAEIYKAYLRCAAAILKSEAGSITAYDGDRVMAIFVGDSKCTSAVRAALKINTAVEVIIRPAVASYKYGHTDFVLRHKIGIDMSELHAARIGVKGDNDLVWVGRAANHAAKLTAIPVDPSLWITEAVYGRMNVEVRLTNGVDMWQKRSWTQMNDAEIYCTTYKWTKIP